MLPILNQPFRLYSEVVESHLAQFLAWLEPHALLLALLLPPVIRAVGHVIPEELFMVAVGVLAARAGSPTEAAVLLAAAGLSHLVTDQAVYLAGRWLRPRLRRVSPQLRASLNRWPRVWKGHRQPWPVSSLLGFFRSARGAWIAGCGVAGVSWRRFLAWDLVALSVHLLAWSGLGWWLAGDLARLEATTATGRVVGIWLAVALVGGRLVGISGAALAALAARHRTGCPASWPVLPPKRVRKSVGRRQ